MIYGIIALALLFIIGPIVTLRPSARECRQQRIRQYAMQHGVQVSPVSLRKNEKFNRLMQRNPHIGEFTWFRYQVIAEEGQPSPSVKGEWVQRKDKEGALLWEPTNVLQQTPTQVAAVLAQWQANQSVDFLLLELGPRSASIVWNERGDLDEVKDLCDQLQRLLEP